LTPAQIKLKRTESILIELIPEAISQLNDARVHEVDVVEVKCSKGRSDCKVYLDPHDYTDQEKNFFLGQLRKATPFIANYCLSDQGWFKAPLFTFVFDDQLKKSKDIESLFSKIAKEREQKGTKE
jgi:ribosome-binding factor A